MREIITNWSQVDDILHSGLSTGVYTAAVLLAGREGEVAYKTAVGRLSREPSSPAATLETVFDLASLTKTLATTLALLLLVQQGRLSLQATLGDVLPASWLPADKGLLPLVDLLTHQSGLPAWKPFYETVLTLPAQQRPGSLERLAAAEPLEHTPGQLTIYSDLGFMLLKAVVETVSGQNLDAFCRGQLYEPLGLKTMGFRPITHRPPSPTCRPPSSISRPSSGSQVVLGNHIFTPSSAWQPHFPLSPPGERVRVRGESISPAGHGFAASQPPLNLPELFAATEIGLIPGRPLSGQVHDENAWSAGGVAGHAGLFGTGPEVFRLASHIYLAYHGKSPGSFFDPRLLRTFLTPPPGAPRALGFDVPAAREASCGRFFSPRSAGHLGFTGVSYWLDVDLGQIVILLTNRVHLGRDNDTIRPFRPRLYEAVSLALGFTKIFRS